MFRSSKVLNLFGKIMQRASNRCYFGTDKNELIPTFTGDSFTFHNNLYGIQLQKHVLPYNKISFNWKPEEIRQIRRKVPNYVVVLIKKVLDDAKVAQEGDAAQPLIDQYYQTCTYCKIRYNKDNTEIEGLYPVKINSISEIIQEKETKKVKTETTDSEQGVEFQQNEQVDEDPVQEQNEQEDTTPILIPKRIPRKLNLKLYSLGISRITQLPLNLNHTIQIKVKYFIEIYKTFFPAHNRHKFLLFNPNETLKNIYMIAQQMSNQNFKVKQVQSILEQKNIEEKMEVVQNLLKKTLDWKLVYKHIQKIAEGNIKNKKFYQYYSQISKIAKQYIDGKKGKQMFLQRVTKQFEEKIPPKEMKEIFEQQKEKYAQMEEVSVQAAVIKRYLEDLSKIPYSIKSEQLYDLDFAEKVLEEEHYGMKEVKDAILQIIAVGKLKGTLKGKIFCLIGGPGLGKTTIAKSVAKALGRKFYNISLGGVTDSSVLKGHRRTYVAAYAGKIIQALKHCQTNNPVILLDQIDKMGGGSQGDPRSQLLQILDPNQNSSFVDNYIDAPVDLSNVLFICSANYQQNISKPLLDRMERIYVSSYTDDQKKQIFKRHLLRRAIIKSGVKEEQFVIQPSTVESLINQYCFGEPGVRRIEKNIEKIMEKIAFKVVLQEQAVPIVVNSQKIREYLGNSYYRLRDHKNLEVGMAISLGGGHSSRLTYIQSFKKAFLGNKKEKKRSVMFTGSLGNVFKEAMNISFTYARKFLAENNNNYFLYENQVHIHAPDGASKKDGATDSLTITTSLVSLALGKEVRKNIAMTGELTLNGQILRTSGIKEKVLLARRQKIVDVIIPQENRTDVDMLQVYIKEGLTFHFVKNFNDAYKILFENNQQGIAKLNFSTIETQVKKVHQLL